MKAPVPAAPLQLTQAPVRPSPAAARDPTCLEGWILATQPLSPKDAPLNGWKHLSFLLLALALMPLALAGLVAYVLMVLALRMVFGRSRAGGQPSRSWVKEFLAFQLLGKLFGSASPTTPVFVHVVGTSTGEKVSMRQVGDFADGHLFVGHHVKMRGRYRRGTFHARHGFNVTTNSSLTPPSNRWRTVSILLFLCLLAEGACVWSMASHARA